MADVLATTPKKPEAEGAPDGTEATPEEGTPPEGNEPETGATDATAQAEPETTEEETGASTAEKPGDSAETKKLKREAQGLRTRLRDSESREATLQSENASLKARLQTIDLDNQISTKKDEINAKDPDVVRALIVAEMSKLQFDGTGTVTGFDEVLQGIKEKYPTLFFGPGSADGATKETAPAQDMKTWFQNTFVKK